MKRFTILFASLLLAFGVGIGGYAAVQDDATPDTDADPCATPMASPQASPEDLTELLPDATPATGPGPGPASPAASPETSSSDLTELLPDATPATGPGPGPASPVATPATGAPCAAPEAENASNVVVVEFVDIAFIPSELTIPADTDITFQFVNNGGLVHNFMIDNPEVFSGDLAGGQSSEVMANLPAGEYEVYCTIPGHAASGMVGTLIVQ